MMKMASNVEKREKKTYSLQKRKGKGGTEDDDMVSDCNCKKQRMDILAFFDKTTKYLKP